MVDIKQEMKNRIEILDKAAEAYYAKGQEIMSNFQYDKLYDELEKMEKDSGIVLAGSPTQKVGYQILSALPKEKHPSKMLSLAKTKDREELKSWLGNHKGLLSWKLDGLTIVLTYENGHMVKAVTRGNGEIGEVVTSNAKVFKNLPLRIPFTGRLVLRGEAVIGYKDFEEINRDLPEVDAKYKNPRNLCSGSVRQLDSSITAKRRISFYAFTLVSAENPSLDFEESRENQMKWLKEQGFDTVDYRIVGPENIVEEVGSFEKAIINNPVPSDGLVLAYDDIAYSKTLGSTAKFPRDAIAFKWQDETAETVLEQIEWSASRTGLVNPIAVFDPVELEGTTVTRASLHNVSIMEELQLGIGDRIKVYKANMIIPQIGENLTKSGCAPLPENCPVCGTTLILNNDNGVKTLSCPNDKCTAKKIKAFALFVSRNAMNIEGLSEATMEKFIDKGLLKSRADIYRLVDQGHIIKNMEGFGEKSFENMVNSIEKSKDTTPERILYALGIPGIGTANAKLICDFAKNNWNKIKKLEEDELLAIDGIGSIMADAYTTWFNNAENAEELSDIEKFVKIDEGYEEAGTLFEGLTFVITGSLNNYKNRGELKKIIESKGGKVADSVSSKTNYLINNNVESTSGKNKKAKELGVQIIDENTISSWLDSGF